jgi:DNA mismatch endonuclease, patch repair protein
MRNTARRDTPAEIDLRRELHRRGLRYFVDRRPVRGLRTRADVVFPGVRIAVFVDGCFWHGCPHHASWPKANAQWWREKIEANRRRDTATDEALQREGWRVVRVWEHEDPELAANRVAAMVAEARDAFRDG